ncbi:hypothetical protein JG688_00009133 [Phytophthora aleatoria]|uniref:Uncharacterized protein n=1 Tax=Phytophthora aleatoria TaxID=2496075 RepID=A0A8J5J3Y7_9STRA|nr:hypothetical protein JG688_00009133 [Phytophthora aleatoria]
MQSDAKPRASTQTPRFSYLLRLGLESIGVRYAPIDLLRKAKKNQTTEVPNDISAATANTSSTRTTGPTTVRAAHRVRLCYRDEAYRLRTEERTKNLITDASLPTSSSTSALLAKKVLKYRKVYDRMTGVDVNDPNFDVFEFLGVDRCKSSSMETSGRV